MIDGMRQTWGDEHNYVICHTDHEYQWNGAEGADWGHAHYELDIQIGGTVGYEVYGSNVGGYFKGKGDGGYLNCESLVCSRPGLS
ncbi:hypothetical protein FA10DRAFT_235151 [Acaromyces ingoldii]|uniref:Uncharacterized protein n=1 Tax=Acaromyces ingoldii TaxID=215250 RepID=A0A316YBG9_9BASI|nr:hypothetical protein FA10DRAFT_235151 [Acaromyces ingoldii]PWN86916.1 hypothetical protein FA10DRAFT_235151 [Acaromyces ingoldii]